MKLEDINPMQWLAINVANQTKGQDKLNFESQIEWVKANLDSLHTFEAKEPAQQYKAIQALKSALRGERVSIPIGLDASCSGVQIMSALTGCMAGARATNLVLPDKVDGYSIGTSIYNKYNKSDHKFQRDDIKLAIMAHYYGSKAIPRDLFKSDENLLSFYRAMEELSPRSNNLLEVLVGSWNPSATHHYWKMPDGFDVYMPTEVKERHELIHPEIGVPTVMIKTVIGTSDREVSNAANLVHSYDAYVLRSMVRRLSYDPNTVLRAGLLLAAHKLRPIKPTNDKSLYMAKLYNHSRMVDVRFLNTLEPNNVGNLSAEHIDKLSVVINRMLSHDPIPLYTIHDDFRTLPSGVSRMAQEYKHILAELNESNALNFSLSYLGTGVPVDHTLGNLIRNSTYALS